MGVDGGRDEAGMSGVRWEAGVAGAAALGGVTSLGAGVVAVEDGMEVVGVDSILCDLAQLWWAEGRGREGSPNGCDEHSPASAEADRGQAPTPTLAASLHRRARNVARATQHEGVLTPYSQLRCRHFEECPGADVRALNPFPSADGGRHRVY